MIRIIVVILRWFGVVCSLMVCFCCIVLVVICCVIVLIFGLCVIFFLI